MKFTTKLRERHGSVWGQHISVPAKVATHFADQNIKRIICTVNDVESFHCAIMPNGDGTKFINLNKELSRKLKLQPGDEVYVALKEDKSKYGMPLPPEMEELLLLDPDAEMLFHKLTKGKQRSLLYIIGKPKTSDTRLKKAIVVTEYLKMTGGKLDFRDLNEAFKQAR